MGALMSFSIDSIAFLISDILPLHAVGSISLAVLTLSASPRPKPYLASPRARTAPSGVLATTPNLDLWLEDRARDSTSTLPIEEMTAVIPLPTGLNRRLLTRLHPGLS